MFTIFANQIELSLHEVTAMNGIEHFMKITDRSIDRRSKVLGQFIVLLKTEDIG